MSLAVNYAILQREVATTVMGYASDPDLLSESEVEQIDDTIRSAYVDYLYPEDGHVWGFLRPWMTMELDSDTEDYNAPRDFGGVDGKRMYYDVGDGSSIPIDNVSVQRIGMLRSKFVSTNTGRCRYYAVNSKPSTGQEPQRSEIMFWPKPDGEYTVRFTMIAKPERLSRDNPYPWGSEEFGEVLVACAKAAAAIKFEPDGASTSRLIEEKTRRLRAAIRVDKRKNRGQVLGYNGDGSDARNENFYSTNHKVTYGGVVYDGE
jgi:hypothetical protein